LTNGDENGVWRSVRRLIGVQGDAGVHVDRAEFSDLPRLTIIGACDGYGVIGTEADEFFDL